MSQEIQFYSRLLVAIILCTGAVAKWVNFRWFAGVLTKYRLVPARYTAAIAFTIVLIESLIGTTLLAGWWLPWSTYGALGLFALFTAAICINLAKGRFDIECGCSGLWKKKKIGWDLVLRNLGLAGLAGLASGPAIQAGEQALLGLSILSVALVVMPFATGLGRNGCSRNKFVHFEPTQPEAINEMLRLAEVSKNDVIYDLGCGDGRILIAAAKAFGARGVGIDISRDRIKEARENSSNAGVSHLLKFHQGDLFDADIREATVVTLYLLDSVNEELRPKLLRDLKAGTRIVSWRFDMGDWRPRQTSVTIGSLVYLWIVPKRDSAQDGPPPFLVQAT